MFIFPQIFASCEPLKCLIYIALTLLDYCLKVYTTLWNIWTYQLLSWLCKKKYTICIKLYKPVYNSAQVV